MRVTKEPEERRAELVAAAQELFDRNGIRNTQVSQIAEKVGVAKGLFYYYFSSKDEVVDEVIGITLAGMEEKSEKILQNQEMSFYAKAAAFIQMYLDMIDRFSGDEEDNLNNMLEAIADNRIARNRNRLLVQQTHRLIDQGVEEGILTTAWPHETVRVLIQGCLGVSREKLLAVNKVIAILEQSLGLPEGALMREYEKLSMTGGEIEDKPDGLFSINSFAPERHKTVGIADEKPHACFHAAAEAQSAPARRKDERVQ